MNISGLLTDQEMDRMVMHIRGRGKTRTRQRTIRNAQAIMSYEASEEYGIAKGRAEVVERYKENCPHNEGDRAWMKSDCHVCEPTCSRNGGWATVKKNKLIQEIRALNL